MKHFFRNFKGRSKGRGGHSSQGKSKHFGENKDSFDKNEMKCHRCSQFGHIVRGCCARSSSGSANTVEEKSSEKAVAVKEREEISLSNIETLKGKKSNTTAVKCVKLDKVLYVNDLRTNLMAISKITDRGFEVRFLKSDAIFEDKNDQVLLTADRVGDLYFIRKDEEPIESMRTLLREMMPRNVTVKWDIKIIAT